MARQQYYDAMSMCEYAQYIDEHYICIETGKECGLRMHPNQYYCRDYTKYKYNKGDSKNGTINGSGDVDF